jgi:hypothetical protein
MSRCASYSRNKRATSAGSTASGREISRISSRRFSAARMQWLVHGAGFLQRNRPIVDVS